MFHSYAALATSRCRTGAMQPTKAGPESGHWEVHRSERPNEGRAHYPHLPQRSRCEFVTVSQFSQ